MERQCQVALQQSLALPTAGGITQTGAGPSAARTARVDPGAKHQTASGAREQTQLTRGTAPPESGRPGPFLWQFCSRGSPEHATAP